MGDQPIIPIFHNIQELKQWVRNHPGVLTAEQVQAEKAKLAAR